jgi:hypothetical protein
MKDQKANTEAIEVELRRSIGFDTALSDRNDLIGVVVYTLDTKVPYRKSPVKVEKSE